jgi:hypothetical protein
MSARGSGAPSWKRNPRFARRTFLRGLGAAGAVSPFIPLLNASAQEAVFPRRLLLWFTPHGTIYDAWKPTVSGASFTLGPILAPLERHKSKLLVLDGMRIKADGVGAPHTKGPPLLWTASKLAEDMTFTREDGSGGMYYGWNTGPSVDQVIAAAVGGKTAYRSLELGVRCGGNHPGSRMIYTAAKQPLAPATDPSAVFDRLFADIGKRSADLDRIRADRASVLDVLKAELDSVRLRTGSAERFKLDAHLGAIRDIETALTAGVAGCTAPARATRVDPNAVANMPVVMDRQIDILAAALACDLTRVASVQVRVGENDGDTYGFLGNTLQHHLTTHAGDSDAAARAELIKTYTWYSEKFAYLLDKLAAIPEGNGTLLDNTLVVWGSELGKGNSHSFDKVPFVIAGGAGGAVKPGRVLPAAGIDHNRLLVSMCQIMGLPEIQTFGNTDVGKGPLAGLVA